MTETQRPWANDEAMSADAIKARIADFCAWTGATPPELRTRKGSVILDDALETWFVDTGACMNWVVCGDVKGMALAYAERNRLDRRVIEATRQFDDIECAALLMAFRLVTTRAAPMDAAMEAFRQAVTEKRTAAKKPAPVLAPT
jgi:hypothetical protein